MLLGSPLSSILVSDIWETWRKKFIHLLWTQRIVWLIQIYRVIRLVIKIKINIIIRIVVWKILSPIGRLFPFIIFLTIICMYWVFRYMVTSTEVWPLFPNIRKDICNWFCARWCQGSLRFELIKLLTLILYFSKEFIQKCWGLCVINTSKVILIGFLFQLLSQILVRILWSTLRIGIWILCLPKLRIVAMANRIEVINIALAHLRIHEILLGRDTWVDALIADLFLLSLCLQNKNVFFSLEVLLALLSTQDFLISPLTQSLLSRIWLLNLIIPLNFTIHLLYLFLLHLSVLF